MHRANPYTNAMTARDVRRSTIIDDGPLALGVSEGEKIEAGWVPGMLRNVKSVCEGRRYVAID